MKRFVFLDRDGTLIKLHDYLSDPALVELLPGVPEGLSLLASHDLGLAVVTNQSGVGRGYYTLEQMHRCNQRMAELLAKSNVRLDAIYFCPHGPGQECNCRKPLPGMIEQARKDFWFEPSQSFIVGDNEPDIGLARNVGGTAILVTTGHGAGTLAKLKSPPDFVANDFLGAAKWIITRLDVRC